MAVLCVACVFAVFVPIFLVFLKIYSVLTKGKCSSKRKLNGMTVLVTGSNQGIGYMTALNLAKRGARVIITSENYEAVIQAQKKMVLESGNDDIIAKKLDFLSLAQVREFAKDILATETRLDILINNAGSTGLGDNKTKDGLLPGMQVNYFGPFLLTNLLLGLMKQTPNSRIVNIASSLANLPLDFDVDNINKVTFSLYEVFVYCNSKICMAHFTIELAKKLKGTGVTVNCLHPGAVQTEIHERSKVNFYMIIVKIIAPYLFKTPEEGAQTSIHLAVCERAEGVTGKYFSDCKPSRLWTNLGAEARAKVWKQSVQLVGLKPEEMFI